MSRKKFFRLRRELVVRIIRKYGGQPIGKAMYQCRDLKPTFNDSCKSYAEAWEQLFPARELVGM